MFKKIFLSLLLVIILAVAGVTIYINLMDWNEHKAVIAKQFSETTGKKINFNGAVSFKLLPTPSLEASNVDIYDVDEKNQKILLAKISKVVASLSFKSLLQRRFNIEHMSMVQPEIFIEIFEDGKINWQVADTVSQQDFSVRNVDVSFGSVIVDKAKVSFEDKKHNISLLFDDVNAEVVAGSFSGPYRIEGSYIKNGDSRGFAFDFGKFSDSFATSVNAVLTHPQSESYIRFDGTVMVKNEAINGNLLVESKNPINFINSIFSKVDLSDVYENPLAMSLAVKTDKDRISLSNVVVKYADSVGAGNVFIPMPKDRVLGEENIERPQIEVAFNFTDLNMDLAVLAVKDFLKANENEYSPNLDFDVIADIKSLKTNYKGQVIRDLDISADFVDNVFTLQNFAAGLPFDGAIKIKGDMSSKDKMMNYLYNFEMETLNFGQTAEWLGFDLKPVSKNVYKRAAIKFMLSGTPQTIKLSPFVLNLDKTLFDAKLGLVRGDKNKYFAIINADNISFDNYVEPLPEDMQNSGLQEKVDFYVKKLEFLKDVDLQLRADLKSGIWQRTPFEKAHMEAAVNDEVMKVSKFSIADIITSQVDLKGELSGFGSGLQFKNLKYSVDVKNNNAVIEKFALQAPRVNWKNLPTFFSEGIVTGDFNRLAMKSVAKLGYIDAEYEGEVSKQDNKLLFDGKLNLNSDDTVKTLHDFSINYNPVYPLGILKLSANVKNTLDAVLFKDINLNVGVNNFSGDILFSDKGEDRPSVKTNLSINKFEFERFFYNTNDRDGKVLFRGEKENVPFLSKPIFSKVRINYDFMKDWDIEAKINVGNLSYDKYSVDNASWLMSLKNQVLKVSQFVAEKENGVISMDFELDVPMQNQLKGKYNLKDFRLKKDDWSGLVYGLENGLLSMDMSFNTDASSFDDMFNKLSAQGKVVVNDLKVKGWNMSVIYEDFLERQNSDNLRSFVQENHAKGGTNFDNLSFDFVFNTGSFDVKNAVFKAKDYSVSAVVGGGIANWIMNADFSAHLNNVKDISDFSFGLDGDISAPTLEVDVEQISKFYNEHKKQVENKVKSENDARVEKYKKLMDEQQQRAKTIKKQLQLDLLPRFKACMDKVKNQKIKAYYDDVEKQILKQNAVVDEILSKREMVDIDDDTIADIRGQIDEVEAEQPKIMESFDFIHGQDVRIRMNESFSAVVEQTSGTQKFVANVLDIEGKAGERLAKISTKYSLYADPVVVEKKQHIEKLIEEMDAINAKSRKDMNDSRDVKDLNKLEQFVDEFDALSKEAILKKEEIVLLIGDYQKYIESKAAEEEKEVKNRNTAAQTQSAVVESPSSFGSISTAGGKKRIINFDSE
ncbi:MAG: AsmA family protein [Alphaproteobacteria bacterium]|nr:AsmA family protein [Alphaproteobacteria bacterium]